MKITVLVDNHTYIDQYYYGEPAVCYCLEDEGQKLLLDVGYSDLFMRNAKALNLDLGDVETVVVSHGHDDHTGGFPALFGRYQKRDIMVVAHPHAFQPKTLEGLSIGSPLSQKQMRESCRLVLSREPVQVSRHLCFLGEIPRTNGFEISSPIGKRKTRAGLVDDLVLDDTALAYQSGDGLYIITGCSHSGICNIMEHAKRVCGDNRILGILGGLHLSEDTPQLRKTIEYFTDNRIKALYPCHCVSFQAKALIHQSIPVHEVGVGMTIQW